MSPSKNPPLATDSADKDLAEQARPGHGIPSQDPDPSAQSRLEPHDAQREVQSVLVGGGVVAGAATGGAIGVLVGGPVGVVVGATVGAVVGALGSAAVGSVVNPDAASSAPTKSENNQGDAIPLLSSRNPVR